MFLILLYVALGLLPYAVAVALLLLFAEQITAWVTKN